MSHISYYDIGYYVVLNGTLALAGWIAYLAHGKLARRYDHYSPGWAVLGTIVVFVAVVVLCLFFETFVLRLGPPPSDTGIDSDNDPYMD